MAAHDLLSLQQINRAIDITICFIGVLSLGQITFV
jgi:hypothetical protein